LAFFLQVGGKMRIFLIALTLAAGCTRETGITALPDQEEGDSVTLNTDSGGDSAPAESSPADSDSEEEEESGGGGETDPPETPENSTCNGVDNDGDGVEDTPTTVAIQLDPGAGECVVHFSGIIALPGEYSLEICDEGAYVACNATDGSASAAVVSGYWYPDACHWVTDPTSPGYNLTWPVAATTCGWLTAQPVQ